MQRFASFKNEELANEFTLRIDNYNELDMYEFKSNIRSELQKLLEPYSKQAAEDRSSFMGLI
jgi:hypothetical protein